MPLDALVTGRIATLAGASGFGWVEAVGIKDGRIAFAGSAVELESRADPHTRRHELEPGEIAIPGVVDAHVHLVDAALAANRLNLTGAATVEDGLELVRVAAASSAPDAWIEGAGWDRDRWGRWPTAAELERVAPGRHVAIWSTDRHGLWASQAALAAAGLGRREEPGDAPPEESDEAPPEESGVVVRDDRGAPTGVLLEGAARLVRRLVPRPDAPTIGRAVSTFGRELLSYGVVGVHDPSLLSPSREPWLQGLLVELAERDELPVRVFAGVRADALDATLERGWRSGDRLTEAGAPDRVRMGWLKLFADGSLGSGTAALLHPNADGERGLFTTPPEELASLAVRAAAAGIATQIHAIGDAAVRAALDALAPTASIVPVMPRLEHVQLCDPSDRWRFAGSAIAASVQPVHLREDAAPARRAWGDRAESAGYTWRSLLDAGAVLAFGTDAPVEPIDPWPGIAMAVLRRWPGWPEDEPAFGPAEALSLEEALRAATIGPATIAREPDRGRLVPGAPADLIVLPAAPRESMAAAEAAGGPGAFGASFAEVRPRLVLIDGEVMVER